ncbi:B-cell receptor CD22-like [Xyrichtys novacula]|uniref:B-cell receptor CD22-like n=1 Tax=Xyrichtys novacula TaxID=13765 RepID=A0AAV1EVQ8_XYRNO|nr:B-cell receptor CD22-like [Xyrichtys novacula]
MSTEGSVLPEEKISSPCSHASMREGDMSLKAAAAARGLVVLFLSLSVIQGQNDWSVTYPKTQICALKGSTVDIPCTYTYPSRVNELDTKVEERLWFTKRNGNEFVDLITDPDYNDCVEYHINEIDCTLRIKDLRESDSTEYKFRFTTNQPGGSYTGRPGVTLSVTDLQVQVKKTHPQAELRCHSSCNVTDNLSYIWYKNGETISRETSFLRVPLNDVNNYSCAVKGHEDYSSPPVYAPKMNQILISSPDEIVEGSSVTLTCSSDANPPATFTWYKRSRNVERKYLRKGPQLVLRSIQSSDSGQYYCEAENNQGRGTSDLISIAVRYAPKLLSVSVSPSAEIVEGNNVTLTCSSDANPAATYTWYKENENSAKASGQTFTITEFRAEHSGSYYCEARNRRGRQKSALHQVVVADAPKRPSVSVSPSAEIVEGSSVNLICSSDANPAATYTWYKENEDSANASGQTFTITEFRANHSGNYYCEARNKIGHQKSSPHQIVAADAPKFSYVSVSPSSEIVEGSSVTLTCISYANPAPHAPKRPSVSVSPSAEIVEGSSVNLTCSSDANPAATYTWYKENEDSAKASGQTFTITEFRANHSGNYYCEARNKIGRQKSSPHQIVAAGGGLVPVVAGTVAVVLVVLVFLSVFLWIRKKRATNESPANEARPDDRGEGQQEELVDLQYASISFSKNPTDLYSNIRPTQPSRQKEQQDVTEYAAVNVSRAGATKRTRSSETGEDPTAVYSTVNKSR